MTVGVLILGIYRARKSSRRLFKQRLNMLLLILKHIDLVLIKILQLLIHILE